MNMDKLTLLPPFLRGCTFDGEKGKIVIPFIDSKLIDRRRDDPKTVIVSKGVDGSPDELEEQTAAELSAFRSQNCGTPSFIIVEGIGGYAMAQEYETAYALSTGKTDPKPTVVPGDTLQNGAQRVETFDRNNVVRNKIAVVTGGAQGFGEGLVRHLVSAGALVFIADLNIDGAERLAADLNGKYGKTAALPVQVNVADEDSVEKMVKSVVLKAGGIDLLISNAGVLKAGSVKELSLKDFHFVTDVNYIGYFLVTKYTSKVMTVQNRGARAASGIPEYFSDIVQINSKSGLDGSNKNGAYAGGKFGGIGLTQSFAKELIADNIKVNSICPGNFFDGPLWSDPERGLFVQYLKAGKVPGAGTIADVRKFYEAKSLIKRGCTIQDVANAIYYVVEQKYETGQAVPVTGGQIMLR